MVVDVLIQYGLLGLLGSSYLMSVVFFPGFVEGLIPLFVGLGFNPLLIFALASIGSIAGGATNYYLGFVGHKIVGKFGLTEKKFKEAEGWLNKWGIYSILVLSFFPGFPFDLVAIFVGLLHMNFKSFFLWMTLGKILKYGIVTFGVEAFLNLSPLFGGL